MGGCTDNIEVRLPSESENYLQRLEDLRDQVKNLVGKISAADLDWQPFKSDDEQTSNSLAMLVAHSCGAEHFWIGEVIGGLPPSRNRDSEFATKKTSQSELFHLLHQTPIESRAILSPLTPDQLEGYRVVEGRQVSVRWAVLHVIDHTALHLGHMQMTYQLLMGGEPFPAPLWSQRIP